MWCREAVVVATHLGTGPQIGSIWKGGGHRAATCTPNGYRAVNGTELPRGVVRGRWPLRNGTTAAAGAKRCDWKRGHRPRL